MAPDEMNLILFRLDHIDERMAEHKKEHEADRAAVQSAALKMEHRITTLETKSFRWGAVASAVVAAVVTGVANIILALAGRHQ
jgi:hypothetical protein